MIERYVDTGDGARLFATEIGRAKADTVVLCDGLACDGFIWRYLKGTLAEHYRVIHWHYRGHGNSVVAGKPPEAALKKYAATIHCELNMGRGALLGRSERPLAGEDSAFLELMQKLDGN